jgi:hypothetical protein
MRTVLNQKPSCLLKGGWGFFNKTFKERGLEMKKLIIIVLALMFCFTLISGNVLAGDNSGPKATAADLAAETAARIAGDTDLQNQINAITPQPGGSAPLLPTAVAHAYPLRATVNSDVQFIGSGSFHPRSGETLDFSWSMPGTQFSSTSVNPGWVPENPGTYVATLRVEDSQGYVDVDTVVIKVETLMSIDPSISPSSGVSPLTVDFSVNIYGGVPPYLIRWDFGDGGGSTLQNTSHTYNVANAITYNANVIVTDAIGNTESVFIFVPVQPPQP